MFVRKYTGIKNEHGNLSEVSDALLIEHPLSVSINGEAFTLTMQTPGHESDLIRGLLFAEGVYKKREGELDMESIALSEEGFISQVNVLIDQGDFDKSLINKRNLLSAASCGICGKTELAPIGEERLHFQENLQESEVKRMYEQMHDAQRSFKLSGGSHAAAIFNSSHHMMVLREDVGRHNAVDKAVGALLNEGRLSEARFLLCSGRVSYEIVTKCFTAGIPFLLAVSAPSSLAVDFAKELGVKLLAFCRDDRFTVYS